MPVLVDEVPALYARHAHWVRPELVGEVRFGNWTGTNRLRHPTWRGLRLDKSLSDVVQDVPPPWWGTPSAGANA